MLHLEVSAVMLSGPVAVPPKVMFSTGHPDSVIPPVVLYVKVVVVDSWLPPGLGHGIIGVDIRRFDGGVFPVGDDLISGHMGHGFAPGYGGGGILVP